MAVAPAEEEGDDADVDVDVAAAAALRSSRSRMARMGFGLAMPGFRGPMGVPPDLTKDDIGVGEFGVDVVRYS